MRTGAIKGGAAGMRVKLMGGRILPLQASGLNPVLQPQSFSACWKCHRRSLAGLNLALVARCLHSCGLSMDPLLEAPGMGWTEAGGPARTGWVGGSLP